MNEAQARRFLLVRAVETEDAAEALLTREDRQQATASGLDASAGLQGRRGDDRLLSGRADFAFARLQTRFPPVEGAERSVRWPNWLGWLLPLAALILGFVTNEIDSGNRLNIIAFPLLGTIAWNLAIYIWLVLRLGTRRKAATPSLVGRLATRGGQFGAHQPLAGALGRFGGDWLNHGRPLLNSRVRRTLHLSAAALAAGIIAGMYLRALGVEYRAGWESTFIGAETLHGLLGLVLAPASALTGIAFPGADQLAALRWSEGPGENAAPWIHLFAATAFLFIIAPRLLLAAAAAANAYRLKRRFPVPGREDFYVRRLLRDARGEGASVRIIPYSFHPPAAALRRLESLLAAVLGSGTQVSTDPPIAYGEEDGWLSGTGLGTDTDHLILLFNLSATPETENHGALAGGVRQALAKSRAGAGLTAMLDESGYRERLAGPAGAEERLRSRRAAWQKVLGQQGVQLVSLDLANTDEAELASRLEGALVRDPALLRGKAA